MPVLGVIKLLIDAGTAPYNVTASGWTALHFVCQRPWDLNGTPDPQVARSYNPDYVKTLIVAGASLKAPAYSPTYMAQYPENRQKTASESVLPEAEKSPIV